MRLYTATQPKYRVKSQLQGLKRIQTDNPFV